jgi:hypothetical protein
MASFPRRREFRKPASAGFFVAEKKPAKGAGSNALKKAEGDRKPIHGRVSC